MAYDTIHNIASKDQRHIRTQPSGTEIEQQKTTYDWTYSYASAQPHAPSLIGERAYSYDLNGNQTGWDSLANGTRRTIVWDEENRIQSVADNGRTQTYKYDDAGERVIKRGAQGETAYVNQFFTVRNREVSTMHVFAGGTWMVSKLVRQPRDVDGDGVIDPIDGCENAPWGWTNGNGGGNGNGNAGGNGNGQGPCGNNGNGGGSGPEVFEADQYFFHPDHLGSSSYVTDVDGEIFQHLEYFPFGETWVEESSNTQRTPYLFTGKELDEQTGLYYFGARYYDPRTSVWQSPDPILADYMRGRPAGGIHVPANLAMYSYAHQRPVVASDPNGEWVWFVIPLIIIASSPDTANAPGPNDPVLESNGLANGVLAATGARVAVGGATVATRACLSNATCARTVVAAEVAGTISDGVACMGGDGIACAAAAVPIATTGGTGDELLDLANDARARAPNQTGAASELTTADGQVFRATNDKGGQITNDELLETAMSQGDPSTLGMLVQK